MGKLLALIIITAAITALIGWYVARTWGFPIVKADETETSRTVKRTVLRILTMLGTTAVLIFCLFMVRAALDLVT